MFHVHCDSIWMPYCKRTFIATNGMRRHKLEPMVTLHHFVQPIWFEKLGGFTQEANIPHFVAFAQTAFK